MLDGWRSYILFETIDADSVQYDVSALVKG